MWRLYFQLSPEGKRRYFQEILPLLHKTKADVLGDRDSDAWYLAYLGTKPKSQGRGYASRLLKDMIARVSPFPPFFLFFFSFFCSYLPQFPIVELATNLKELMLTGRGNGTAEGLGEDRPTQRIGPCISSRARRPTWATTKSSASRSAGTSSSSADPSRCVCRSWFVSPAHPVARLLIPARRRCRWRRNSPAVRD